VGFLSSDDKSSKTYTYTDSSETDKRITTESGVALGEGATFNGMDPASLKAILGQQSDGLKFMTQLGTDALGQLSGSVTNVLDKSGANMAQAWSHQLDVMGDSISGLTAASKANSDAGQVVATAALKANANAGATISDVFKWGALAVAAVVIGRIFLKA
jgi:hypothetical protein